MIGQNEIRSLLIEQEAMNVLPHFFVIVGDVGSGKKTLIDNVFNINNRYVKFGNCKIETIRELIDLSYILRDMFFFVPDADSMSVGAQNALLKVVEECPNNNYYILSLQNENNILDTLHSRATFYRMDIYTSEDKEDYCESVGLNFTEIRIVNAVCDNIGSINELMKYGIEDFYNYVNKVVDNIREVSVANAMKVYEDIKNREYDLKLFFRAYISVLVDKIISGENEVTDWALCQITSKYLQELNIVGVNKQAVFDSWLFYIRQ